MKIILASKSPRRKELLASIFNDFKCIPSQKDEIINKKLSMRKMAEALSEQKAKDIFLQTEGDRLIIGSDTVVVLNNKIYGKPKDETDAFNMLKSLSGKMHKVVTGLCLIKQENNIIEKVCTSVTSRVTIKKLTDDEILNYIATGEPMDKAGSYGIQGIFKKHIKKINGDFFSVMGLPVNKIYDICKKLKII